MAGGAPGVVAGGATGGRVGGTARGWFFAVPAWLPRRLALAAILALAAGLNLYGLGQNGWVNAYYAAGVRSMLESWSNFFFVSFDPGGFVSLDKPPLGFWIQALSAKGLGFRPLSLLLPQALAGIGAVALLYLLVRRRFGPFAGLVAALVLALTPISVATNRNNTIDSLLVLVCLGAVWAVDRAVERGRLRWLLLAAVFVGRGFNVKMLQAYLVLPALWLCYLVAAPRPLRVRLGHLAVAMILLLAVSLAWVAAVDLTPADRRPFVGSSTNNTVSELIVGHNGLTRLVPRFGMLGERGGQSPTPAPSGAGGAGPNVFVAGGDGGEAGPRGPLRLLNRELGGQIGWTLPLAVVGLLMAGWSRGWRLWPRAGQLRDWRHMLGRLVRPLGPRGGALVLWGGWVLVMGAFFSATNGLFHRYYLVMLAPGIAALTGIGVAALWRDYRRPGGRGWLLPLALVAEVAVQARLLAPYPEWAARLTWPIVGLALVAATVLTVARLGRRVTGRRLGRVFTPLARPALGAGIAALLIAPAVWTGVTVRDRPSPLPSAGPAPAFEGAASPGVPQDGPGGAGGAVPFGRGGQPDEADPKLLEFLRDNRGGAHSLVATPSAGVAAPIILATGEPAMALGGYLGSDPILTVDGLAARVMAGEVRFFLLPGGGPSGDGPGSAGGAGGAVAPPAAGFLSPAGQQPDATRWVTERCTVVPPAWWQSSPPAGDSAGPVAGRGSGGSPDGPAPGPGAFGPFGGQQLYDCAGARP